MAAILAAVLLTAVAFGVGRRMLGALGVTAAAPAEEIAFSVALGYGALAYAVFAMGLGGALHLWALVVLVTLAGLWARREIAGVANVLRMMLREAWGGGSALTAAVGALILICAAGNLIAALAPPTGGDALSYHLAVPKIWLEEHRVTAISWRWPSLGPFTVQMLYLLAMALGGISAPSVLAWITGLVAAAGLIAAATKFPRAFPPLLAAGIFYTMSTIGQGSADTRVDVALALYVMLAVLASVTYLRTRHTPWLIVAGVCAGLAAGTKHTGAAAAAILAIGMYAFRTQRSARAGLRAAGLFSLLAAGVAAPWYLRSFVLTGDPVYPFLAALLGNTARGEQLLDLATRYGPGRSLFYFIMLPLHVTAAVGAPYLALAPFSLALWRTARVQFLWYVMTALTVIWFLTAPVIRFLLPALPAAAIAAALGFAVLDGRSALLGRAARATIVAGLAIATAITLYHDARFAPVSLGLESEETFLARTIDNHQDIVWMNKHLPADARILSFARGGFYLQRPYIGAGISTPFGDLYRWLREHRISHIYCLGNSCDLISRSGVAVEILRERQASAKPTRGRDRTSRPTVSRVLRVTGN